MAISFSVAGAPIPQPRPRITVRGRHGHAYTPSDHPVHAYRSLIASAAKQDGAGTHGEPVEVVIDAVFERPKSHLNNAGVKATAPAMPRADVDNIAKSVLDALTGIAWEDDAQVRRLVIEKSFGPESRTTVRIA